MKEDRFIKENSDNWKSFEATLKKLKSRGFKAFGKTELDDFYESYHRICGHLSYCRTHYGGGTAQAYLNTLVASAHSCIYTTKPSNLKNLWRFLSREFPSMVKANIRYFNIALALFAVGFIASFIFTLLSAENAAAFLPEELLEQIDFDSGSVRSWNGTIESSLILTNNIRVGLMAFALGITLCLGTAYVLIFNGFILGAIAALAFHEGVNLMFWSLILPHGILELFAIFVSGAAGLIIGYSIINPGIYSRKDSIIIGGKTAVRLLVGTIPIYIAAGLIEGFFTPSGVQPSVKLLFALFTFVLLLLYLVLLNLHKQH